MSIDKFGRIVIPKRIRADLQLEAGSTLILEEGDECIVLRPAREMPPVSRKEGVLVYGGAANGPLDESLARQRDERLERLTGL